MPAEPRFFDTAADFRRWLALNHDKAAELLVGFWKKDSGRPSIDWPEARDQALCFGWIDGVRKSLGHESYTVRFTPRRPGGLWSRVNLERFATLEAAGLMTETGRNARAAGKVRTDHYSYEAKERALSAEETALFRANPAAWADFEQRPRGYRKAVLYWVTSAKRPETRARRLATLVEDSSAGRMIAGYDVGRKRE